MKPKRSFYRLPVLLVLAMALLGCGRQKAEEIAAFKRDVQELHHKWEISQKRLRKNMETMKTDVREFGELQEELAGLDGSVSKTRRVKHTETKREIQYDVDTLKIEMEKLNQFIHSWNEQSRLFNDLVKQVQAGEIDLKEARERISMLTTFEASFAGELDHVDKLLQDFAIKHDHLKVEVRGLKETPG